MITGVECCCWLALNCSPRRGGRKSFIGNIHVTVKRCNDNEAMCNYRNKITKEDGADAIRIMTSVAAVKARPIWTRGDRQSSTARRAVQDPVSKGRVE